MDRDAFLQLFEETRTDLWAYVAHTLGNEADARDVFQETYLRMLGVSVAGKTTAHQRYYLFRVASNLIADHYRAARREVAAPIEVATPPASETVAENQLLDLAMKQLKPSERNLLWLAHAEEMSHEEIASVTGYKKASIAPLLSNARRAAANAIRQLLGRSRA